MWQNQISHAEIPHQIPQSSLYHVHSIADVEKYMYFIRVLSSKVIKQQNRLKTSTLGSLLMNRMCASLFPVMYDS